MESCFRLIRAESSFWAGSARSHVIQGGGSRGGEFWSVIGMGVGVLGGSCKCERYEEEGEVGRGRKVTKVGMSGVVTAA